ncbi:MAG: hypothetical protein A2Y10_12525 [Planctomycetes bacterium GWF2_41_51]|nr:MAG: hypothetical protein A2Y10_12525 [Planctomycetes bacterium GWF2_41_51]HBG27247.1 hypothetical protein [Phycisphaerales bacterium]
MYRDIDHCTTVLESLKGSRPADEQAFASINILADRLNNVHKMFPGLNVEFSPQVQALIEQESVLAIS